MKNPGVAREKLTVDPTRPTHPTSWAILPDITRKGDKAAKRTACEKSGFQPFLVVVSIPNAMGRLQQYLFLDLAKMFLGIKKHRKIIRKIWMVWDWEVKIIDKDPWKSPSLLKAWKIFDSLDDPA